MCLGSLTWSLLDIFEDFTRNTNLLKGEIHVLSMHLCDCSGQEFTAFLSFLYINVRFMETLISSKYIKKHCCFLSQAITFKSQVKHERIDKSSFQWWIQGRCFIFMQLSAKNCQIIVCRPPPTHPSEIGDRLPLANPGSATEHDKINNFPEVFEHLGSIAVFNGTWYKHMHARIMHMCMHACIPYQ